ncbi:MAG: divergent polysaccharide deacetylase family protein [Deltaproteobacteria bacterium]|nr:divergent polysaccharide deacetylase family protein [Deltaproteobacteria bacterium]
MRKIMRFLGRPGGYIAAVGLFVLLGGAFLWRGMNVSPASVTESPGAGQGARQPAVVTEPDFGERSVISRALLSMANLAYEEPFNAHLEDSVKQADFALVQAMLRCHMPLDGAILETTELRHDVAGPYNFQRLRLSVGSDPLPFITTLHDSLRAWAENAELAQVDGGGSPTAALWTISVNSVVTHELVLSSVPSSPPPTTDAGRGMIRRRSPGEAARLVIVIDDLGEDMAAVRALANLPYPVTFAVWPRSTHARKAADLGHGAGREILIHQPAEPMKYPDVNPGPGALFTSLDDREIEARVRASLSRVPYAVGMNNHMGSRFTRDSRAAAAMVRPLKNHGFFVLDSMTHPGSMLYGEARRHGIPALKRDVFLDSVPGKENVLRQLRKAEKIALVTGSAVAIGHPLPYTIAALKEWDAQRDAHVELVRLSDLLFAR